MTEDVEQAHKVGESSGSSGPSASNVNLPDPPPPPPPTYAESSAIDNYGFPLGYFVIRSVATERLLDVAAHNSYDGSEVILWPSKESSLVEGVLLRLLFVSH